MTEELKIYITNPGKIERKLNSIGAIFVSEMQIVDTYFDMPGMVLKLTETKDRSFLTQLQAEDGGFKFIKEEDVENINETKSKLGKRYGIKTILKKKKKNWVYKDFKINLNLFDDIGSFLIVEGEKVTPEIFSKTLNIERPKYLTKSFAQLKLELRQKYPGDILGTRLPQRRKDKK
ncbi:MAG: hypothetical protein JW991_04135 [Candidatus Pacebacteria bacterium]|nr:hypothetical protein [Candidatus Paceibacterota bacterium]